MEKALEEQVIAFKSSKNRILGRLFKRSYQFVTDLAGDYLRKQGYDGFRVGHLVLLIHLDLEGTTVNILAQRASVTKQAMSKLVQELQSYGYVKTEKHPKDARAIMVKMTDEGAKFILSWKGCSEMIDEKISEVLGKEKLEQLKDTLVELVDFYEANSPKTGYLGILMTNNLKI